MCGSGSGLLFSKLAEVFQKLEETGSHTAMTEILSDLFSAATSENIAELCYLTLGQIAPGYEDVKMGMAERMVLSSIGLAAGKSDKEIEDRLRAVGDLGIVAAEEIGTRRPKFGEESGFEQELEVDEVFRGLRQIAAAEGKGSQELKKKTLAAMLARGNEVERKYLARLAGGHMRLGVGDMTLLNSLATAFLGSKKERPPLEKAYNLCSDIGHVAKTLLTSGLAGVDRVGITVSRPIRPMLAQRVSQLSQIREKIPSPLISAEEKYDGERIQVHKDNGEVRLFSRRLSDVTSHFPDIVEHIRGSVVARSVILDGEAVAYDFENEEYYPFQKLMQRRRKYDVELYALEIPVKYKPFDLLYLDGEAYVEQPYPRRREKLESIIKVNQYVEPAGRIVTEDLDEIEEFFQDCVQKGLEGIVCKSSGGDSVYRAGAREWSWIKWKPDYSAELSDTFDLAVVGAFSGRGKRGGTYGALLCAAYDDGRDVFQTVSKLGAGFTDEELTGLPEKLASARRDEKPARVEATSQMKPDFWFEPEYILEVRASEITRSPIHSCGWDSEEKKGLALRFPRFLRWRPEKGPEQTTTVSEISQMYL